MFDFQVVACSTDRSSCFGSKGLVFVHLLSGGAPLYVCGLWVLLPACLGSCYVRISAFRLFLSVLL